MADATGQFFHDLLVKLLEKDPKILSAILYLDVYNELHFDLSQPPFTKTSGQYGFNGKMYDLGAASGRQALMDQAAQSWMHAVNEKVKSVKADLLVTASSFYNVAFGHKTFDGGFQAKTPATTSPYPLRPESIIRGGADIIDIHTYPSPARNGLTAFHSRAEGLLRGNEITDTTAMKVPLIAGEFGAYRNAYLLPVDAPAELLAAEDALCQFHFSGLAVWMWNGLGDTWTLADDPLMKALAPKYHPDFCHQKISSH